jgi:predicted MFS family arabinose efflux permease
MVFALVKSTSWGWASANTLGTLGAALVLIVLFLVIERRTAFPLVPLSIFSNRSLSVSNLVSLALGASIFSMFYFLSLYMQQVLGYSALKTGIGYLSIAGAIIVAAGAAQALVAKLGIRVVMSIGMALAAGGLVYFAQISPHGTYLGTLLPGFLLAGVGLGLSFVPVTIGAVSGVAPHEAGVASGLITTTQQIGGALGVAVLSTIAVSATTRFLGSHGHGPLAQVNALNHGFSIAFWFGAGFAAIGCLVAIFGTRGIVAIGAVEPGPVLEEPFTQIEPA